MGTFKRLPDRSSDRDIVDTFRGYNHNQRIGEGEFYEMTNMSSDNYPMASPRMPRGAIVTWGDCTGIIAKDELCRTDGTRFFIGNYPYDMELSSEPKQLISMGAYVIILPDKKYINTANPSDRGDIEATYTTIDATSITLCRADGSEYTSEYIGPDEPENPKDRSVWCNTSEYPNRLMQYSAITDSWTHITVSTVKLFSMGLGKLFSKGDGITISGMAGATELVDDETGEPLSEESKEQVKALDGAAVIVDRDDDWIVIDGIVDAHVSLTGVVTVKRTMPTMDFVVEHGNRLWGCRHGLDDKGEFVNIIYASKLGDFKNWSSYQGVDSDSYFANVGTDGAFTGAVSYGDCVLFFKEMGLHTVYGDGPSSYQVEYKVCRGVQKGSGKSVAVLDGVVYYKDAVGVSAYTGSIPEQIGACFGSVRYKNAVGGTWGRKYYISMEDSDGQWHLFAYDSRRGIWHREDNTKAAAFADCGDETYMLSDDGGLESMSGAGGMKGYVNWACQTGRIGIEHPDRKRLTRLNVRLSLETGARARILVRYDSRGEWIQVASLTSSPLRARDYPVRVQRCDHMELRLEGTRGAILHSIVKTYQMGSDRR